MDGRAGEDLDVGCADGREQSRCELPRIDGVFVQKLEAIQASGAGCEESREFLLNARQRRCSYVIYRSDGLSFVRMVVLLQGQAGLKGDGKSAELFDPGEELWVEREAAPGEGDQLRGIFGIFGGEHTGGGGGGFKQWGVGFHDDDPGAAMVEFQRQREPDNTGAGDTDVRVQHRISLQVYSLYAGPSVSSCRSRW